MSAKILFLFTVLPSANIGAAHRTLQTARLLSRLGSVTSVLVTENEYTREEFDRAEELMGPFECLKILRYRRRSPSALLKQVINSRTLESNLVKAPEEAVVRLDQLLEAHELVWIHTLKVANAFRKYRWNHTVLDLDGVQSKWCAMAASNASNPLTKLDLRLNTILLRRSERHLQERFAVLVLCDPADRKLFQDPQRVQAIANGFDGDSCERCWAPSASKRLGMIGVFSYPPNRDGILWFLRNVWPKIRVNGDFEMILVGKGGEKIAEEFQDCGVIARGFVQDLGEEVREWAGMIVPTRIGGGTHVKIAEGMSMGLPMIVTTHGCRGYNVVNGDELLIADEVDAFAEACVSVLQSPELQERLSAESRKHFEAHLTWDVIAPDVERAVSAARDGLPLMSKDSGAHQVGKQPPGSVGQDRLNAIQKTSGKAPDPG